jgi:type III secretion system low calcium response chaperone LcrH/SycD
MEGFTMNHGSTSDVHGENESVSEEQAYVNTVMEAVCNGMTLKDLHGVDPEFMEGVYAYAYQFYEQGRLDDAEVFFRFLCIYDFYNCEYAVGLGAVYQLKKKYQKAIDIYGLAFTLGKRDYRPMLYAGQCNLLLARKGKAKQCFEMVIEHSTDEALKTCAAVYLEGMVQASENL